jgi:hypothetical protein
VKRSAGAAVPQSGPQGHNGPRLYSARSSPTGWSHCSATLPGLALIGVRCMAAGLPTIAHRAMRSEAAPRYVIDLGHASESVATPSPNRERAGDRASDR